MATATDYLQNIRWWRNANDLPCTIMHGIIEGLLAETERIFNENIGLETYAKIILRGVIAGNLIITDDKVETVDQWKHPNDASKSNTDDNARSKNSKTRRNKVEKEKNTL